MSKLWAVLAAGAAMVASVPAQALQLYTIKAQLTSVFDSMALTTTAIDTSFEAVIGYDENSNIAYFHTHSPRPGLTESANRPDNAGVGEATLTGNSLNIFATDFQDIRIETTLSLTAPLPTGLGQLQFSPATISVGRGRALFYSGSVVSAAITAVPEPATWLMMVTGIGIAGAGLRRRMRPARLTGSLT